MRGPIGGYAHAHAGLAAFFRHVERDIVSRLATPEDQAVLAALDAWLVSGTSRALLMGDDVTRRTELLSGGVGRRAGRGGGGSRAWAYRSPPSRRSRSRRALRVSSW